MCEFKIFVSPFKGGTTSVAAALERVGFKRAKYEIDYDFGNAKMPKHTFSKKTLALIGELNKAIDSIGKFEAISEPIKNDIQHLLAEEMTLCASCGDVHDDYPLGHDSIHPYIKKIVFQDSKFIFLERPMDEYITSVRNHVLDKRRRHVFGHCRGIFCGSSIGDIVTLDNYRKWKSNYMNLKKNFPKDVLIMDLEDGWGPLASFLGFEVPKTDFPWANKSEAAEETCRNKFCDHGSSYCDRYDSDFCPVCLEWLDDLCGDENCSFCGGRPERPTSPAED